MKNKVTRDEVLRFILDKCASVSGHQRDDIDENSDFIYDVGFDSLDVIELIMMVEQEYDISLTDVEADNSTTPGRLCHCAMYHL